MKKNVVIIGCGFAGQAAARRLKNSGGGELRTVVIDKNPLASFLPLLPDVLGRDIPSGLLTYPVVLLQKAFSFDFINEEVLGLDLSRKEVVTSGRRLGYDYCIIACGSQTNFYGNEQAQKTAYTLDDAHDASRIRKALDERPQIAACLIAGGGYTGVEIAGNLRRYFDCRRRQARIIIVEKAPQILGPLPEWMRRHVLKNLREMRVEVFTGTVLEKIEGDTAVLSGGRVFAQALIVWCPGVKIPDFVQKMQCKKNPQGRLMVDEYLRVEGSCFAAGDAAFFLYRGDPLRMAVQFAIYQGEAAAVNAIRSCRGLPLKKYAPLDLGFVVPLANNDSCGRIAGINVKGPAATILHYVMCVFRSRGLSNKTGITVSLLKGGIMTDIALFILRLGTGVMFFAHGLQLAFGLFGGPGVSGFSKSLQGLGFVPALAWAYVAAYTCLIGGGFLVVGFLVRISAAALFIFIAVAAWTVHWQKGFFAQQGGYEYNFIIACVCLALVIAGPGKIGISRKG